MIPRTIAERAIKGAGIRVYINNINVETRTEKNKIELKIGAPIKGMTVSLMR